MNRNQEFSLDPDIYNPTPYRRQANLYDAVAGRVNAHGFIPSAPYASKYRDTASSSTLPVRPEEVLYRRQNAPTRYEETDLYFAHEALAESGRDELRLPDTDLLEAIHAYAADFYDSATLDRGVDDRGSMDETALMAVGILVEEMAREALGETGDLVLVEGEEVDEDEDEDEETGNGDEVALPIRESGKAEAKAKAKAKARKRASSMQSVVRAGSSGDELESARRRRKQAKKRRVDRESDEIVEVG